MKLAIVRPEGSREPSEELKKIFRDSTTDIIDIQVPDKTEGTKVEYVEDALEGFDLYRHDTFLLCSMDLLTVGESVSRNALNYGIIVEGPTEGNVKFGRTHVLLRNAIEMPYKGEPRILVVNVHADNEPGVFAAAGHAYLNHPVHLLAVTGREKEMVGIYDNYLKLDGSYTFLGIDDKSLAYSEKTQKDFREGFCRVLEDFGPDVVIQTSPGRNEDHTAAYYLSREILERDENRRVGFILGDAIESGAWIEDDEIIRFSPNLWQAIPGERAEKLMGIYDELESPQYREQVSNLLRRKEPAASSKLYSRLINKTNKGASDASDALTEMESKGTNISESMVLGCYGMQVLRLSYEPGLEPMGYHVPHMTEFLKRRELTK